MQKIPRIFILGNSKSFQFWNLQKSPIWKILRITKIFNLKNFKNFQFEQLQKFLIWKITKISLIFRFRSSLHLKKCKFAKQSKLQKFEIL